MISESPTVVILSVPVNPVNPSEPLLPTPRHMRACMAKRRSNSKGYPLPKPKSCFCGRPAVVMFLGSPACQRCLDIDSRVTASEVLKPAKQTWEEHLWAHAWRNRRFKDRRRGFSLPEDSDEMAIDHAARAKAQADNPNGIVVCGYGIYHVYRPSTAEPSTPEQTQSLAV